MGTRSGGDSKNSYRRHGGKRPNANAERDDTGKSRDDRKRKNATLNDSFNKRVSRSLRNLNQNGGKFSKSHRAKARRKLPANIDGRSNNATPIGLQGLPPSSSNWPKNGQKP